MAGWVAGWLAGWLTDEYNTTLRPILRSLWDRISLSSGPSVAIFLPMFALAEDSCLASHSSEQLFSKSQGQLMLFAWANYLPYTLVWYTQRISHPTMTHILPIITCGEGKGNTRYCLNPNSTKAQFNRI